MLTTPEPTNQQKPFGRVVTVRGSSVRAGLLAQAGSRPYELRATVGRFLTVRSGANLIIGIVTEVTVEELPTYDQCNFVAIAAIDLLGEINNAGREDAKFQRGVTVYPSIGDIVSVISSDELRVVYTPTKGHAIHLGQLQQDPNVSAFVDVNETASKHFAVLGSTGVGKSTGVALILHEILRSRADLRIFLVDVHNEYGRCFGENAQVLNPRNLKLPFWLFNFEEIVDVFFGGRSGAPDELEILLETIPIAKATYSQYQTADRGIKKIDPKSTGITADTPIPYRIADLINLIDERMGRLENRSVRLTYHKLISRINAVCGDFRYAFMFENANVGGDTMAEVISHLFRLPTNGKPMTVMQLAGFPAEVVDSVVSVLSRMAFDFGMWSDGVAPLLFVCEEAHRYASADRSVGFGPTRKALSRIAKEGRKYGVYLGLITQRPAELDPTIISQCNTLFAMRLANERDQALLRSAVSDAAANLLSFLPSLGTREVLAFGEGVALPTRMRFKELSAQYLPRGEATIGGTGKPQRLDYDFVSSVLERWRGSTNYRLSGGDTMEAPNPGRARVDAPLQPGLQTGAASPQGSYAPTQLSAGLNPERFRILKKPLGGLSPPPPGAKTGF